VRIKIKNKFRQGIGHRKMLLGAFLTVSFHPVFFLTVRRIV
jgi:hypothetical protein